MLIDVILFLILLSLILAGYRRGLIMSLMGLVIVVLCCMGAAAAQRALTPAVTEYLEPKITEALAPEIESYVEGRTQAALDQSEEYGLDVDGEKMTLGDLAELLRTFGLDVAEQTTEAILPDADAVVQDAAHALTEKIAGTVVYILAWLILYLVLQNAALIGNVVDRLPVVHTCNRVGGAILGALEGLVPMVVIAAVCDGAGLLPARMGPLCQLIRRMAESVL